MSTFLEQPELRARLSCLPVDAYEALGEMGVLGHDVELIRGFIVKKMAKSPLHRRLVKAIFLFFMAFEKAGFAVFFEAPLRLWDSEPEPDVMIVRGRNSEYDHEHPTSAELIVEVAISSAVLDREKCSLYAEANVAEYWIVLPEERQVEVYRQPEAGVYGQKTIHPAGETLVCGSVPGLQVALADWFA